jgi:hypothetical protein
VLKGGNSHTADIAPTTCPVICAAARLQGHSSACSHVESHPSSSVRQTSWETRETAREIRGGSHFITSSPAISPSDPRPARLKGDFPRDYMHWNDPEAVSLVSQLVCLTEDQQGATSHNKLQQAIQQRIAEQRCAMRMALKQL